MKISLQNLSKAYGSHNIINDFSCDLHSGLRLCVCGANGTGKSTLLKIIAGESSPDAGKVSFPKNCRIGYVKQELEEAELKNTLLDWVVDVLPDWKDFWAEWEEARLANDEEKLRSLHDKQVELEHLYGYNPEHRAKSVLSGLGFSERKFQLPLEKLSGGWRERAKLARVITAGSDLLLLDEPTNHLDLDAVEWLEDFLLSYEGILVFVAHDRFFMEKVGNHILYLGASKPLFRKGSFSKFVALQEEHELQKEREASRIQGEIEHKLDFVRRFKAKATKARQAGSRQKMAKKLEKELENYQPEVKRRELGFRWPEAPTSERLVLSVSNLSFSFPDQTKLWQGELDFSLYRGQKIALVGHNGCGKSTLLKLLVGRMEKEKGSVVFGNNVKIGFFSQHQLEILSAGNTVLSEIRRLSDPKLTEEELMSVLGLFMLGQNYFERTVSSLSGGEKSRLILASLFLARCNFLILDEPTNHLDLESREALVEALNNFTGTILMVAHDRYLLSEVAEQVWLLDNNGFTVYENGFLEYAEARKSLEKNNTKNNTQNTNSSDTQNNLTVNSFSKEEQKRLKREEAEQRNKTYRLVKPLQEEYEKLEHKLNLLITEESSLEQKLAEPETYADPKAMQEFLAKYNACKAESEKLLLKMSEIEEKITNLQ
ncbi:ABC-F family ATP-binding cassette domain-containing protein [Desulfovibrio litoralis]|uniref:ATP-binding cassette, subfamily F, member 3 n=1 Tax=Desulfovibrio litoralis DSM 11393 TaxID=1121455 RepID=A0A1M7TMS0_9BACT|nr:ABC-F family ATP-binding cassette domain-containing protein [Desulfovibrio litoralis]SHN72000.1 ATP-binding cassette, subfamily F, member 3 [Desulfovibrio litoralis DSM 11393]